MVKSIIRGLRKLDKRATSQSVRKGAALGGIQGVRMRVEPLPRRVSPREPTVSRSYSYWTTIRPVIADPCTLQSYEYVPGVLNVSE